MGEVTPEAARKLLVAAVEAFAESGYHATTTRDIAGRAGMSPAALYIHYKTKEELLHRISRIGHDKALEILTAADAGGGTPSDRLADAVRSFVRWHAGRHDTAHVVQYEIDALSDDHRTEILSCGAAATPWCGASCATAWRRGVRRPRCARHHGRRAVALHRRGAVVQRAGSPDARRGRRALRRPRPAHGRRSEVAQERSRPTLRSSSGTPTRPRTPACRRPRAPL